jgi:uncharacterized protein YkwD
MNLYNKKLHHVVIISFSAFLGTAGATDLSQQQVVPSELFQVELGEALSNDAYILATPPLMARARSLSANNLGGWAIETHNRQLVRQFYNSVYLGSLDTPMGWTGDITNCQAGTTTSEFKDSVLDRVNYFRAMAGVPAAITFNSTFNTKAQQAALIMSANNFLSHAPPAAWDCYTSEGDEAAGQSNIALGTYGWDAISGYILDWGASNGAVAHRRWILHPQTQEMGTGDISGQNSVKPANALWVFDGRSFNSRPATREPFIAWPAAHYNPYQTVPARWSFSYDKADFTSATITMTESGSSIPTVIEPIVSDYGENTLVWIPDGMSANTPVSWPKPVADKTYDVTIANVLINGVLRDFNYPVIVFDPAIALVEEVATITGNAAPATGTESYEFNAISQAIRYDVLIGEVVASSDIYNAETNGASVTDNTSDSYDLIQSGSGVDGSAAYDLRFNEYPSDESFEILNSLIPSASSRLLFESKLGYSGTGQIASVQVSADDGASWKDIFSQVGTGTLVDNNYVSRSFSLASYADKMIRIRVRYQAGSHGSAFNVGSNISFLVDNLRVSYAKKIVDSSISNNGSATTFSASIEQNKEYILSARAVFWDGYAASEWGDTFSVIANSDSDGDGVENSVDNCVAISNPLQENYDGDSEGNVCDVDDDNDGMPDVWENKYGLNPLNASDADSDLDSDGVTNLDEYLEGTDPLISHGTTTIPPNIMPVLIQMLLNPAH